MSSTKIAVTVDDTIHIVIFYKIIIREFLKYFKKKYLSIKGFKDKFNLEKSFKFLIKEEHELELELKGQNQSILLNNHALQLHNNALQRELQSRRRDNN